jgi:hypothetical protein
LQSLKGADRVKFRAEWNCGCEPAPYVNPTQPNFVGSLARRSAPDELCLNLGDGVNQAADFIPATSSIPSLNFTPLMTFGNWFRPFDRR